MAMTTTERVPARERLLAAAEELFYEEGVHTVGIDRVIERAGVAKATLYSAFGSKDELVRAYLARHDQTWRRRLTSGLAARYATPRERLLGVFDVLGSGSPSPTSAAARSSTPAPRPGPAAPSSRSPTRPGPG